MDYQVWTKEEYADVWTKVDCGDLPAARREIDLAVRAGREPLLTVEVPYKLDIKISEVGAELPKWPKPKKKPETKVKEGTEDEAKEGETESGEGPGAESPGAV